VTPWSCATLIFAFTLLTAPLASESQTTAKIPRIGVLLPGEPESQTEPNAAAFRQALRDLGYVEGQTVAVEYRYAHGDVERYPVLAAELVRLQADIMVVGSGVAALAAKKVTQTIPIVVVGAADPVGSGLVASLARPGGNVTGLSVLIGGGLAEKWVDLLKEAAPRISQVGYLRDANNPLTRPFAKEMQAAAQALGLQFQHLEVSDLNKVDSIFAALSKKPGSSLIVMGEPLFFAHRNRIPELATRHRLPAIYTFQAFVDAGGLISYGPSLPDLWRRAVTYVDRILKGAKPADLPVEQPTKFELVINLKTAKTLGLTIPQSLLLRADQVIE
jgi:ABC-type uncharacterized transport system substrate-binding protein